MAIAAVLGSKNRKDGYLEGPDYIVTWGIGHLVELANADSYDEKYAKWRYDDLPIVPANWKYKIPRDKYQQFEIVKKLMNRELYDMNIRVVNLNQPQSRARVLNVYFTVNSLLPF